jgi:hypothetical protein
MNGVRRALKIIGDTKGVGTYSGRKNVVFFHCGSGIAIIELPAVADAGLKCTAST